MGGWVGGWFAEIEKSSPADGRPSLRETRRRSPYAAIRILYHSIWTYLLKAQHPQRTFFGARKTTDTYDIHNVRFASATSATDIRTIGAGFRETQFFFFFCKSVFVIAVLAIENWVQSGYLVAGRRRIGAKQKFIYSLGVRLFHSCFFSFFSFFFCVRKPRADRKFRCRLALGKMNITDIKNEISTHGSSCLEETGWRRKGKY